MIIEQNMEQQGYKGTQLQQICLNMTTTSQNMRYQNESVNCRSTDKYQPLIDMHTVSIEPNRSYFASTKGR